MRFWKYVHIEYVNGTHSKLVFNLHLGTHGLLEESGGHAKGVSHRSVLIVGLVRSHLSMFFSNVHYMIPRDFFL